MSVLFNPAKIGTMDLPNRFVRSATAECLADDNGRLTEAYLRTYSRLAKGGVGLIVTGNYYVNAAGRHVPRIPVMDADGVVDDLKRVTDAVHEHGTKIVAQLNHAGRQGDPQVIGASPVGPSPVTDKLSRVTPREMTSEEIEKTVVDFGEAARKAKEAGFDGVQIHAAHGYLVNQFLSGHTNRRTDQWGGTTEKRQHFLFEIYDRIRSVVGPEYPILVKINGDDGIEGGVTIEETVDVCRKLEKAGIDAIEVSGGIAEKGFGTMRGDIPRDLLLRNRNFFERLIVRLFVKKLRESALFEEAYFLPLAAAVKKEVGVPVIAVGGMRRRTTMEKALENGQTDFISFSRPFVRQPAFVRQMENDDKDPISCKSCNRCAFEVVLHYNPLKCYNKEADK
ncbi:MAG: NADH:flavin oxidoreductase [Proteobacteria bacterium]|nr:NADH:flavin oxidoreductase [Pseudomonadota bacterium]